MMYFGLPVEHKEAMRLLKNDTRILGSGSLDIFRYHKNVYILGFKLHEFSFRESDAVSFSQAIKHLAEAKLTWDQEIRYYNIDLSVVHLAEHEAESHTVNYPEPFLIC